MHRYATECGGAVSESSVGLGGTVLTAITVVLLCVCHARGTIIADSIADYSGTQGQDGWYYGFYDGNVIAGPYTNADFEEFANYGSAGNGLPDWHTSIWYHTRNTYWTAIWDEGGHPNAKTTSFGRTPAEHWPVRRWVSETDGVIEITGVLHESGGAGDGVIGYIFVDGMAVFSHSLNDDDPQYSYSVTVPVNVGTLVDFAIAPKASDWTDATKFTAVITPEPSTMLLLGLGGLGWLRRRRA